MQIVRAAGGRIVELFHIDGERRTLRREPRAGGLFQHGHDELRDALFGRRVATRSDHQHDIDEVVVGIAVGDLEHSALAPASLDLATSLLALHHANDLPGALIQIRAALRPDGLFVGALLGGDTLAELRQALTVAESDMTGGASPRVAPFADVRALGGLLQRAGFALPVVDADALVVRYPDMFALLRDLRAFGGANALVARSRQPARRELFARAAAVYAERFSDPDGRIRATFEILWISGWAPHASQPKPLKPGSAAMRLEDALNLSRQGEPAPDAD